jgi:hypothetical protein
VIPGTLAARLPVTRWLADASPASVAIRSVEFRVPCFAGRSQVRLRAGVACELAVPRGTVALTDPARILTEMTVREEATDSTL